MAYLALYRKYRPQSFEEVRGQDHIVTTLKNQMKAGRIGHAYLFCGTRGTGKTSVAKLFAKAVNCESPVDGSPCGKCPVCRSIDSQVSMNVVELDAASNNSVENIREIIENVKYSPTSGKYKVFIIDEVHMLSGSAFNALLKTLEEPPAYVIFILATTEVHKIPITILSRCQRYYFKRITTEVIAGCLSDLMKAENIETEEKALKYVARTADGSMRDAQSLLDQCIAFYLGQKLTYEKVLEVLGSVDIEVFARLLRYIVGGQVDNCLKVVDDVMVAGRELGQFVNDFAWYLRNLLIAKTTEHPEDVLEFSKENMELLLHEAGVAEEMTLIRYISILSELSNRIRYASQKRVLIEMELIRLAHPEMDTDYSGVLDRIRKIEERLEKGIQFLPSNEEESADATQNGQEMNDADETVLERALPEDIIKIVSVWDEIKSKAVNSGDHLLGVVMTGAAPSEEDGKLILVFKNHLDIDAMTSTDREHGEGVQFRKELLQKIIASVAGVMAEIEFRIPEQLKKGASRDLRKDRIPGMNIPIITVD